MFIFQDVKKKSFYEDEILIIKSIVYRLIKLLELSEKVKFLQASNRELRNEVNDLSNLLNLVSAIYDLKTERFDDPEIALKKLIDSKPPSLIILEFTSDITLK